MIYGFKKYIPKIFLGEKKSLYIQLDIVQQFVFRDESSLERNRKDYTSQTALFEISNFTDDLLNNDNAYCIP